MFTPTVLVVAIGVAVVQCVAMLEVSADPRTESLLPFIGVAAPAVTGATIVLGLLGGVQASGRGWLARVLIVNLVTIGLTCLVMVPLAWSAAARGAVTDDDYRTETTWDVIGGGLSAFGILGYGAALLGATAALVLVLLPFAILTRPERADEFVAMDEHSQAGTGAALAVALPLTLVLVFLVPSFVVFGLENDNSALVTIGWLLIPVGVVAVGVVLWVQRAAGMRRLVQPRHGGPEVDRRV